MLFLPFIEDILELEARGQIAGRLSLWSSNKMISTKVANEISLNRCANTEENCTLESLKWNLKFLTWSNVSKIVC